MRTRLELIRAERGLTQTELAEKAGLSRNVIWRIERSHGAIRLATLGRLAMALEVDLADLAEDVEIA